jgi:hypothetical protein
MTLLQLQRPHQLRAGAALAWPLLLLHVTLPSPLLLLLILLVLIIFVLILTMLLLPLSSQPTKSSSQRSIMRSSEPLSASIAAATSPAWHC